MLMAYQPAEKDHDVESPTPNEMLEAAAARISLTRALPDDAGQAELVVQAPDLVATAVTSNDQKPLPLGI